MPISRFHIRSEHSLADPELHRAADKDDPEALLEAVAMAGLVGVLRQLGDLAQFAAEIFHDLHEEVLATSARGHSLVSRVQQLEAEVPAMEKVFLSQTHHSSFFTNGGIDWHPNLRSEQNLVARGDLPRFIMDSYEECRGPPRLFLLDKFDVAGAGACLKRYTDPSFFKVDPASSVMATVEVHQEKRIHKVKPKKVAQPRNGESPVSSHAKLHQLFLEERIENACRDPARLVKLKKKQLNGSAVESKTGKSYMEKILEISSPDRKMVSETSTTPLPVQLMSDDTSENGIKILEISSVSPVKRSLGNESTHSSPNEQELELETYSEMDRETNGEIVQVHEEVSATASVTSSNLPKVADETELGVDEQKKREYCLDGYRSDDVTSEVDDYLDALATMEEFETDIECRPKKSLLHIQKVTDSNGKEDQLQAQFSDSQSFGDSLTSEEISFFNQDRNGEHTGGQDPLSDSHSSRSSCASEDNRLSRRDRIEHSQLQAQFSDSQSIGNSSTSESENGPSNQLFQTVELPKTQFGEFVMHDDEHVHEEEICDCKPVSSGSRLMNSGLLSSDLGSTLSLPTGTQSGETPSGTVEMHSRSEHDDKKSHVESIFVVPDALSLIKDDGCHMVSSDNKSSNNLDVCDPCVNSNALLQVPNDLNLAYEDEYGDHSMTKVLLEESPNQHTSEILSRSDIDSHGEDPICPSMETDFNSGTKLPFYGYDIKSENDVIASQYNSEDLSSVVEPQGEPDSAEAEVLYSDWQSNSEEVPKMMLGEEIHGFTVENDGHSKHLSSPDYIRQDNLVTVNDASAKKVHSEDQPLSALPLVDRAESDESIFTSKASGFVSSPSRNLSDLHEPFSCLSNSHQTVIESNEVELTKISVDLNSEKRENKLEPSLDILPSPMKSLTKLEEFPSYADSHEKEMEVDEEVAKDSSTELMVPREVDQPEIAFADVRLNSSRSVPFDPSDPEICNDIQEEKTQCSSVNDKKMVHVSPELDSQSSKDSFSSPSHNQLKPEVGRQDAAVPVRNEKHFTSEKFQLQQIQISNQLEQQRISHAASEFAPEMHQVQPSSFDSSPKSSFQETNCTKQHATDPMQPFLPDLFLKPTNNHEEMPPPLPPLPPMQWRMGKVQHTSPVSQREETEGSQTSFQPIQPVKPDDKSQFGLPMPERNNILYQNPFLPFMAVESNMLQHSSGFLAGVSEHPITIPLQFPIMVNETNGQYNYLVMDRSQNQNPFLTLPVVSTGRPPHGYVNVIDSEGEMVQNSSPCPSIPPTECSVSEADSISPHEKLTESMTQLMEKTSLEVNDGPGELHSVLPTECAVSGDDPISPKASLHPHQLMEETSLEVEKLEQSSIDLESKQVDPCISTMSPPSIEIVQPNDSPVSKEGVMVLPSDTSVQTREFDSKMPNGKPKNKLPPPPQNALIDIFAAIDKSRLRKVSERVRPQIAPKVDERDSLLEQIRSKSFNLRPAVATRPIIQGPKTNLRVAAILEKANSIRQALAGSDEDDDADSWSDS